MAKSTQALSTGLRILAGSDVPVYTLEHLTSSRKFRQGSFEKIVVPYIELGRDNRCAVAFGEDYPTVSRKHAAIMRNGKEVKIKNLSATNPLLINGRPVKQEYFLNSGDEIQLSLEGPRLRYNTSATGTAKMGFTNKMNLVIQQAVKPYKTAALTIAIVFLTSISTLGYFTFRTSEQLEIQKTISAAQADSLARLNAQNLSLLGQVKDNREEFEKKLGRQNAALNQIKSQSQEEIARMHEEMKLKIDSAVAASTGSVDFANYINDLQSFVLAIYWKGYSLSLQDQVLAEENFRNPACMCTGFLLNNGDLVTARHCIDLLMDEEIANFISNSGGKLELTFNARSFDGSITLDFKNTDMRSDFSRDKRIEIVLDNGTEGVLRIPAYDNGSDWAFMPTNYTQGLVFDKELSGSLVTATELHVLGYPDGEVFREDGDMRPDYNKGIVRRTGLTNGVIRGIQGAERGGNSGGPVFTIANGVPKVDAIVTGARNDSEGEEVFQVYTPLYNIR